MTKIIGLTGGIGSGKTTIANYFKTLGIPVYIADDEARAITDTTEILNTIKTIFGKEVFQNDSLDRKKLAQIVFDNPDKLQKLNAIIHPAVQKHFKNWLEKHSNHPFVIKETAILFESGSYKHCDIIITVVVPLEIRIKRVMQRDKISKEAVLKRIQQQWSDEQKIEKSTFIIDNLSLESAKHQVNEILKKLIIQ